MTKCNLILIFCILTFLCCCGRNDSRRHTKQDNIDSAGNIVSKINDNVWVIYQDLKGNYWFGTNGQGVYYYNGEFIKQYTVADGLVSNQIRGIQEDRFGDIYFDTPEGISKFKDSAFFTLIPIHSSRNNWKLQPNDLWFKGNYDDNSVYRYDGDSLYHLKLPEYDDIQMDDTPYSPYATYSIYKDLRGTIWFGTLTAGVYTYNGSWSWIAEKELVVLDDGRVPGVRSIVEDKDGNFWFSNILSRYSIHSQNDTSVDMGFNYQKIPGIVLSEEEQNMKFPYYISATVDHESEDLWMVTYDEGVWKYDGTDMIQYLIKEGKRNVHLFCIYKDNEGTLWLGTDNGIYRFNGSIFKKFHP